MAVTAALGRPVREASGQPPPTPPFPTLAPTDPFPTLPPSVPTPSQFTATATRQAASSPTPVPSREPSPTFSAAPPSASPSPSFNMQGPVYLPFLAKIHLLLEPQLR